METIPFKVLHYIAVLVTCQYNCMAVTELDKVVDMLIEFVATYNQICRP